MTTIIGSFLGGFTPSMPGFMSFSQVSEKAFYFLNGGLSILLGRKDRLAGSITFLNHSHLFKKVRTAKCGIKKVKEVIGLLIVDAYFITNIWRSRGSNKFVRDSVNVGANINPYRGDKQLCIFYAKN